MKKIILTLVILLLVACSSDDNNQVVNTTMNRTIGDVTKTPNLGIAEKNFNYKGYTNGFGIRVPPYDNGTYGVGYTTVNFNTTVLDTVITYFCPIENRAPINYSGIYDFVVNKVTDGTIYGSGSYTFDGLLSITTYRKGLPIGIIYKNLYDVQATDETNEYDNTQQIDYNQLYNSIDYMWIPAGTADSYTNRAIVRSGLNLIVVEVNPGRVVTESNYDDNISKLPVNVTMTPVNNLLGTAVVDLAAIDDNRTRVVTNLSYIKDLKGRDKSITIDWDCPYHSPIYVKHWFRVKKNGVIVADNLMESTYKETVRGNYNSSTYEVQVFVEQLGMSTPESIYIPR